VSKEKFELLFLGGGALLDVLGNRMRRKPRTPQEVIGAAMHALTESFQEHRDELADPDDAGRALFMIRAELVQPEPDRDSVLGRLNEFDALVGSHGVLADEVRELDDAIRHWLG
jgi:hypothetical protein